MSQLPQGWSEVRLDSISKIVTGKTPSKKDKDNFGGNIPFIKPGDILNQGYINSTVETITEKGAELVPSIPKDSITVTCIGNLGRVAITKEKSATNQQINTAIPNEKVEPKYLFHYLRTIREWMENEASATTVAIINKTKYSAAPIRLPSSKDDQKRIADKLDSVFAKVEAAQARLEKTPTILKRFRQSVLAAATSGELTKDWREENETNDISPFVDSIQNSKEGKLKVRTKKGWDKDLNLYKLPTNWAWISNHKLAEDNSNAICAGPFGTIFKAKDFRDVGVPIIFLRHVKENGFNQNKPNFMDKKVWQELHQEYSVFGGELLVTKLGDPPGEACIYPRDAGTAMVTPDVLKMSVDSRVALTEYLQAFFNSPNCKDMVRDLAFGATRLRIDIAMFKNFPIPLPPLDEQVEIISKVGELFEHANTVEKQYNAAKARLDKLTQSILAKAFRGELL